MVPFDAARRAQITVEEFVVWHVGDLSALMLDLEGHRGSGVVGKLTGHLDVTDEDGWSSRKRKFSLARRSSRWMGK